MFFAGCVTMSQYRLFKHKDYDRTAESLPLAIQRKALWAQVLLGTRGRTPSVKGTTGLNARSGTGQSLLHVVDSQKRDRL